MITTKRLTIIPLTYDQLLLYLQGGQLLEKSLQLSDSPRTIAPELKEALEESILPNVLDPTQNPLFTTLWTAISRVENTMVGDFCFHGAPNAEGEIEIGYGTYEAFQRKGYMTEMVGGMLDWLKTQPLVKSVVASTEKTNLASFKVLERQGFVQSDQSESMDYWKLVL